jgi:hypothetical protein
MKRRSSASPMADGRMILSFRTSKRLVAGRGFSKHCAVRQGFGRLPLSRSAVCHAEPPGPVWIVGTLGFGPTADGYLMDEIDRLETI